MKRLTTLYFNSFKGLSAEVWWLALITLINRAGTMVVPFLSLYLTESLKFTLTDVGWIMTAFGLGSVTGSWLGGKFTDKIGAYKTMVFSLTLSGFLFLVVQYASSFAGFCMSIFILMAISDMFRPAMFVALHTYSKPENKTRSVTLIRLAINLGFAAGPALGGLIITKIGYNALFWVDGLTCLLAVALFINVLNPKKSPVNEDMKTDLPTSAYKDQTYWLFVLAMLLFGLVFMQYFSTIPIFYRDGHGLSELEIGLLFGINGFIIFAFEMPLVKWLEKSKKTLETLMIIGVFMVGLSVLAFNLTGWSGILVISILLMTFGEMILFPFSNAFAMERSNRGNRGEYMAMYMMAFSFAHIFSHNGGMQLIDSIGFTSTWFIITGLTAISVVLLLLLKGAVKRESPEGVRY